MPLPQPLNLDGTVAAATGAASELGIELSGAMTETGADVVCSDVREGACDETPERVRRLGSHRARADEADGGGIGDPRRRVFLASAASTCMTGQMLAPDGCAPAKWDKQRERSFTRWNGSA